MPKLSVIIPAHNAEQTIEKSISSVLMQSFPDWELFVVCDACTDKTAEIVRRIAKIEQNVRFCEVNVQNECLGRNIGLDNTSGEWILFIDSDDWYLHEFCFQQLMDRAKNSCADIIAYDIVWKHIGVVPPISGRNGQLFPHCTNKMWRRSFIGTERFLDVKPDGDATFHKIMMAKSPKIEFASIPIYYYNYLRPGSYSARMGRSADIVKNYWKI